MNNHFYSHLLETDSLTIALDSLDLAEDERKHIMLLIESTLHHAIIDAILSELSPADKKTFIQLLESEDHAQTMNHLMDKVDNIEEKIKKAADELKKELHKDIDESK
jgi:hypothetical protein